MTGGRVLGKVSPRSPIDFQPGGISALLATRLRRTTPSRPSALDCGASEQAVVAESTPAVQIDPRLRPATSAHTVTGAGARRDPFPFGLPADAR